MERHHSPVAVVLEARAVSERALMTQFCMSVANLDSCHVFWSISHGRMFARSARRAIAECFTSGRGRPALPKDAIHVATYTYPCAFDVFRSDLRDALASAPAAA